MENDTLPRTVDNSLERWAHRCRHVMKAYGDAELGHDLEDSLLEDFVKALAQGEIENPTGVAAVILNEILRKDRTRWYA
jgi:hypothetical protein